MKHLSMIVGLRFLPKPILKPAPKRRAEAVYRSLAFEHFEEGETHIIQTELNGTGRICDMYNEKAQTTEDKVKNAMIVAYCHNQGNVYKLDEHTKCNEPVSWRNQKQNWWMRCNTIVTAAELAKLRAAFENKI